MHAKFFLLINALIAATGISHGQKFKKLEPALQSPTSVIILELRKDRLENIPTDVLNFTNLEVLDLSNNDIESIDIDLSSLEKLHTIILSKNNIHHFPMILSTIPNLRILGLDRNPIDSIPDNITEFIALEQLDLWDCDITYVSRQILRMEKLNYIDLRNTYFKSEELKWITEGSKTIEMKSTYGCNCN